MPATVAARPLGSTELSVLESIVVHRLLTTGQLQRLHTPTGQTRSARWMQQIVAKLRHDGLVTGVHRKGSRRLQCWFATPHGNDVAAGAANAVSQRVVQVTEAGAIGQLQSHTLAVNEVGLAFVTAAKEHGHECGPLAWEHEIAHQISDPQPRRHRELLIADALLHYAAIDGHNSVLLSRFIELDRATMSVQDVAAKLRRYVRFATYVPSDARAPAWQVSYPQLPGVIVVLTGRDSDQLRRRRRLLIAAWQVDRVLAASAGPSVSIVMLEDLRQHGPWAPIFVRPSTPDQPVDVIGRGEQQPIRAAS